MDFMTDTHNELAEEYRKEMGTTGIDWDSVDFKMNTDYVSYDEENDMYLYRVYLGSVLSLAPSGKYWTWWACSNVDDEEQVKDIVWFEMLEEEADKHGFWIESGEGDACDLYAVREATREEVLAYADEC